MGYTFQRDLDIQLCKTPLTNGSSRRIPSPIINLGLLFNWSFEFSFSFSYSTGIPKTFGYYTKTLRSSCTYNVYVSRTRYESFLRSSRLRKLRPVTTLRLLRPSLSIPCQQLTVALTVSVRCCKYQRIVSDLLNDSFIDSLLFVSLLDSFVCLK